MLKNRIIPCLDVKNGRVVKGINFVDLKDAGDPVEQAQIYSDSGADEICFLDITASNENRDTIYDVELMSKVSSNVNIPVIASGGVGNLDHLVDGIKLGNANAVLAASIFHYGQHSVKEAKEYLDSKGIPVRI